MTENTPFTDPTMARLVEIAEREYVGTSDDGTVRATMNGALVVVDVTITDAELRPGPAGALIVEALDSAFSQAKGGVQADVASLPGIAPQISSWLDGEAPPSKAEARPEEALRTFSGSADAASVTFDNRAQRFTEVYLPAVDDASLKAVATAANRALAAAQTGRDGVVPLDEMIDDRLEQLDRAMDRLDARLDDVLGNLERIEKDLPKP